MSKIIQDNILKILTNIPKTSEEIGKQLNYSSVTIRVNCSVLSALGLVTGIPGPQGGYIKKY